MKIFPINLSLISLLVALIAGNVYAKAPNKFIGAKADTYHIGAAVGHFEVPSSIPNLNISCNAT